MICEEPHKTMKGLILLICTIALVVWPISATIFFLSTIGAIKTKVHDFKYPSNGPSSVMDTSFLIPFEKAGNAISIVILVVACILLVASVWFKIHLYRKARKIGSIRPLIPFALLCAIEPILTIVFNDREYIANLQEIGFGEKVTEPAFTFTFLTTLFLFLIYVANAICAIILAQKPNEL